MPPRKRPRKVVLQDAGDGITVKNRGKNSTSAVGRRAKAVVSQANTASQLKRWRKDMERWIDTQKYLPPAEKTDLKQNVAKVAEEVSKGKQADSGRLERLLNVILSIAQMSLMWQLRHLPILWLGWVWLQRKLAREPGFKAPHDCVGDL